MVRWLRCSVVGDGSNGNPFRPKLFENRKKHNPKQWSAVYYPSNPPYQVCLVRFEEKEGIQSKLAGDILEELDSQTKHNSLLKKTPYFKARWLDQPVSPAKPASGDFLDPVETRYMRSDTHTINTYTYPKWLTTQSGVAGYTEDWGEGEYLVLTVTVVAVERVQQDGTKTFIGAGPIFERFENGEGIQSDTFSCPQTALVETDAIDLDIAVVVGVGVDYYCITEQLGATQLDAAVWTFYVYTYRVTPDGVTVGRLYYDTATYISRVTNFTWTGGAAPQYITPAAVASSSSIQSPSAKGSGSAPITLSAIVAPSTIQAPSLSGTGVASIALSPIQVVSQVQAPEISTVAVIEQEGFRFRADDGDEDEATWLANQDVNISRDKNINTRLRILLNASGNPESAQYQLEYRKVGEADWKKV